MLEAALRHSIGLAYGCKNGACGTCRGKLIEGPLVHRDALLVCALGGLTKLQGFALFCSSFPLSDIIIEARELTGFGDIPIRKLPTRIAKIERPAPDVAIISLQLPAKERLQFRAGQYLDFILKTASVVNIRSRTRRMTMGWFNYTCATRQAVCLQTDCSAHSNHRSKSATFCGSKRRSVRFFCAKTRAPDRVACGRHRLCSDQGDRRACIPSTHQPS